MHNQNIQLVIKILLLLIYIILFVIQLVSLILFIRKKKQKYWVCSSITAMISSIAANRIMFYYDGLPGYGPLPGLTYFSEWIYSFWASIIFAGMFLLSIFLKIILKVRTKHKT